MAEAAFEPAGFMGHRIFGLPIDREILFSNHKDVYKKRVEKRQRKLIVKTSFLKPFEERRTNITGNHRLFAPEFAGAISYRLSICLS